MPPFGLPACAPFLSRARPFLSKASHLASTLASTLAMVEAMVGCKASVTIVETEAAIPGGRDNGWDAEEEDGEGGVN